MTKAEQVQPNGELPEMNVAPIDNNVIMMQGVAKMIAPTIMQCGKGGYITVIPGVGVYASTTLDDAMAFVEDSALKHFTETSGLPRIVGKAYTRLKDARASLAEKVAGAAKGADYVLIIGATLALMGGWLAATGATSGQPIEASSYSRGAASGLSIRGDSEGMFRTRKAWVSDIPKVDVRGLPAAAGDGDAERALRAGTLRPLRSYNEHRGKGMQLSVGDGE